MARRRRAIRRNPVADPKHSSVDISRFINKVMVHGKKTVAQRVVYDALDAVSSEVNRPPVEVFEQAIRNVTPMVEVRSRRVGGATYQVPTEVRPDRRLALAMRWIVSAARARTGRTMSECLAQEFLEAARGQGTAVKRKEDLYRMAEANRAFAHYRW